LLVRTRRQRKEILGTRKPDADCCIEAENVVSWIEVMHIGRGRNRYPNEIVCSKYENNTLYSQPRKTAHLNLQKSSRRSGYGRAPFEHRDKDSNTRMSQPCKAWPSLDKDSIVQCRSIPVLRVVCSYPKSLYIPKDYPLKLFIPASPSSVRMETND
jgi:hypothetical protein